MPMTTSLCLAENFGWHVVNVILSSPNDERRYVSLGSTIFTSLTVYVY